MKPLLIANWKINPPTLREATALARGIRKGSHTKRVTLIVAPPFPFLFSLRHILGSGIVLSAQDISQFPGGAYTGGVSGAMLKNLGARSVIIGHSERRRFFGDTNEAINQKMKMTIASGLRPILAIGEETSDAHDVVPHVLKEQIEKALYGIPKKRLEGLIIAYEPVWAIGSGKADTPDNATRRAIYIRKLLTKLLGSKTALRIPVLYGGSVTSKNAASFITTDIRGMDGLLVGRASLNSREFLAIEREIGRIRLPR